MVTQWFNLGSLVGVVKSYFQIHILWRKSKNVAPKSILSNYFGLKTCSNHCENSNLYIVCYKFVCFYLPKKFSNFLQNKYQYISLKNIFSCFSAFLRPQIEKLAFYFLFMKGLKSKNKMLTFLFWVPKMPKNGWKYFLNLYKFMDYNEVWFSRLTFHEKAKKNTYRVFYLADVGQNSDFS